VRNDYAVYRVTEPDLSQGGDVGEQSVDFERFAFRYPAGAHHNAETLLVHPQSAELYVVTKPGGGLPATVYRFPQPLDASGTATLERVGDLPVPTALDVQLTGGSFAPCGDALLLRMYNRAVELTQPAGQPPAALFGAMPLSVASAAEPQGEAITYSSDGRSYFTASEGSAQQLHRVDCTR
jgi:hypothetical protein